MIDVLKLQDSKQTATAVESMVGALGSASDLYLTSSFRLPAKMGGMLMGVYDKKDNRKYLEMALVGKVNKRKRDPIVMSETNVRFTFRRLTKRSC